MSSTPKNCEVPERRRIDVVEARASLVVGAGIFEVLTQLWLIDEVQVVVAGVVHAVPVVISCPLLTSMTGIEEF
jgi:hypothetical protein